MRKLFESKKQNNNNIAGSTFTKLDHKIVSVDGTIIKTLEGKQESNNDNECVTTRQIKINGKKYYLISFSNQSRLAVQVTFKKNIIEQ